VRPILRLVQIVLLALAGLYGGDYLSARYRIPNNRRPWQCAMKTL